jgi:hypothetical protein
MAAFQKSERNAATRNAETAKANAIVSEIAENSRCPYA